MRVRGCARLRRKPRTLHVGSHLGLWWDRQMNPSTALRAGLGAKRGRWHGGFYVWGSIGSLESFLFKFSTRSICGDFWPGGVCPEVFAFYLHFRTRAWAWGVSVALAGVFIFACWYEVFAVSAFVIWIHISPPMSPLRKQGSTTKRLDSCSPIRSRTSFAGMTNAVCATGTNYAISAFLSSREMRAKELAR